MPTFAHRVAARRASLRPLLDHAVSFTHTEIRLTEEGHP